MKVFLSSTALDLGAYRKVADDTILRLSEHAVAMERFGALPGTPVEECERMARECDVTVCIVAHRYGWIPEKGKGSITRREVESAKNAGKDVLVWIVADNHPWTENKETDQLADPNVFNDLARVEEVREAVKGLSDFKSWLRTTFTPETFTTPDDLAKKIAVAVANYARGHALPAVPQDRISIARLPTTGSELFGREAELEVLDDAWGNSNTNIVSFVAWGGVGKTALVNHWLKRRMARDNYRGAERVFGWSFFSQGTSERAASADLFIDQALRWFGDTDPTAGSPWDKGERLARYIRQTRTLLILDGLEPLQYPPGAQEGRLKDAALQSLLVELAAQQPGLCVISTRERVGDLAEFEGSTVVQHELEYLSPQAGAQILRSLNVKGDDQELEQAATELGGHAFSLTLLGSYLDEVLNGDIRRRKEIENLFTDTRYGDAAQRIIATYEKWLGVGLELAILRLLGLFDRPADLASIMALRDAPVINGLMEPLQHFKSREWSQSVAKLRRLKLLGEVSPSEPGTLDAHPLVREYFKQQLKRERTDAWREANNRLYEHLKNTTKEFPETVEEMSPLLAAVAHGCEANRYEDTFVAVYWERVRRKTQAYIALKLGAYGADLATVSNFFEKLWDQPVQELPQPAKAYVLNVAGFGLRSVGRLQEAAEPMSGALQTATGVEDWDGAARAASNLSQLFHTIGNLSEALGFARLSVKRAKQSPDPSTIQGALISLAVVLHETGNIEEAEVTFVEAESLLREKQPAYPLLYGVPGFHYCDLLLTKKDVQAVKARGQKMFEWRMPSDSLVEVALDNLILGRAWLLESPDRSDVEKSRVFLQQAVDGLRQAAMMDYLPRGLLARGQLYRFTGDYKLAERDLAEVVRVAVRSGMGLHLANYHLESAWLRLAQNDKDKARPHLKTAEEMVERMGYHRRDKEVAELEEQLG